MVTFLCHAEIFNGTERGQREPQTHVDRHETYRSGGGQEINERVGELADQKGVSTAQIVLTWQFRKETVTAPLVGVTTVDHLKESVEALGISLTKSDINYLEEPYESVQVSGHGSHDSVS